MGRPPAIPTEEKLRLVLSVVSGEMTIAQAARHGKVSEQSVSRWKQQFLAGGKDGLAEGGRSGISDPRERELLSEIEELKAALGEAHVQLRVWRKSAEGRLGPSRTSR
jgi:transposase